MSLPPPHVRFYVNILNMNPTEDLFESFDEQISVADVDKLMHQYESSNSESESQNNHSSVPQEASLFAYKREQLHLFFQKRTTGADVESFGLRSLPLLP